jgi:lipopolysaccharide/colanic/teichoic acid biosynthesis glycosyltransferase
MSIDQVLALPEQLSFSAQSNGGLLQASRLQQGIIRLLDLLIAAGALFLLSPFFLVLPVLIKLNSPGKAFFVQRRLGLGGRPFHLLKFRTMRENRNLGRWTVKNDPRITRLGKLLRQLHLDEIPQLINVIRGDNSIIGPRAYTWEVHDQVCRILPKFNNRLLVKPGLTGWSDLGGRTGSNSLDHHAYLFLAYDSRYLTSPLTVDMYLGFVARTIKYFLFEVRDRAY